MAAPRRAAWAADGPFVYPLDDLRDHDVENPECWCQPFYDDGILVHQSMDRREEYEQGRKPS